MTAALPSKVPPALGLLVAPGPPPHLPGVLRTMLRWCTPRHAEPAGDAVDAWLASSVAAPGLDRVAERSEPLAVWLTARDELEAAIAAGPSAILVGTDEGLAAENPGAIVFPAAGLDASRIEPVLPFVRARWRRTHGLAETMVVDLRAGATDLDPELVPTALALGSAVVVAGRDLVTAMAWGAPCVTDAASAAAVGADRGVHCLVGDGDEAQELAAMLAHDSMLATELARAGRRLVEARHDNYGPALELARRLGLVEMVTPRGRLSAVLDDLRTPDHSFVRLRALHSLAQA